MYTLFSVLIFKKNIQHSLEIFHYDVIFNDLFLFLFSSPIPRFFYLI